MKSNLTNWLVLVALAFTTGIAQAATSAASIVDRITFGETASEQAHNISSAHSEVVRGGLGEPARRLLPLQPESWAGGSLKFTLKVDPNQPNYATIKLWGSDTTRNMLILFCEGKQIGYRHLGDIDVLDLGSGEPAFNERFCYSTTPLPVTMTRGKSSVQLEIRCVGPVWGYGATFDKYQKPMTEPTRGIYKLYAHTDGCFVPPAEEKQGAAPKNPPVRNEPGTEVLDQLKARVGGEVKKLVESRTPLNQMQMQLLARAYHVKWTPAYQNPKALAQLVSSLDAIFVAYRKNPKLAEADPATPNADWFGLGPSGDVLRLMAEQIKPLLDEQIDDGAGKKITRRAAFSEMLVACRDWHRKHRRLYTNQSMINDLYGIYLANRGVAVVDPARALPEKDILRYLYESVGLEPWRDSDPGGDAPKESAGGWKVGTNYWQLTAKGLTKELGYVGYYGEVLDWVTTIYEATRPTLDQPGDEKIRAQLIRMGRARGVFRSPAVDAEGNRAMRIEAVVGWRDGGHYPGDICYAERVNWDGSALGWVSATLDPEGVGYAQQMFADNQFFATLKKHMKDANFRSVAGMLPIPDQYELVKAQPPQSRRLPMAPGQPDFVFSDEEDGVIAIKNGDEVLYASLYWRARKAVNFLARVHYTTPTIDRIAVVREEAALTASGQFYTRPDHVNFGFARGGPKYPGELHSAHAGEQLPIAKIPAGIQFKPGDESVYAGKADFYTLRYGDYLIGMNMTTDRAFELKSPDGVSEAKELVSGKTVKLGAPVKVAPRSTVVLWLGEKK